MTMGPTNKEELRELLTSRQFPADLPGAPQKSVALQTPSDRMREKALVFGETLFGLVPDSEYHRLVGIVLLDLVVIGEMKLCQMHDVKTEHADLLSPLRATSLGMEVLVANEPNEPTTGSVAVDTVLKQKSKRTK